MQMFSYPYNVAGRIIKKMWRWRKEIFFEGVQIWDKKVIIEKRATRLTKVIKMTDRVNGDCEDKNLCVELGILLL